VGDIPVINCHMALSAMNYFLNIASVYTALTLKLVDSFNNIDRTKRFCKMYYKQVVEDEYHFILECKKYKLIRENYLKP
jgi:hypothetical protein